MNISIVVITHKKGNLLTTTLQEVGHQLQSGDQIIVVDDGGEDRRFVSKNICYLPQEHKGYRLSTMRNIGIRAAKNPYIALIDGDCLPKSGWLESYRRNLEAKTLLCGRIDWQQADRKTLSLDIRFDYSRKCGKQGHWAYSTFGGNIAFPREPAIKIGLFDETFNQKWGAEDADFGIKWYMNGWPIKFIFQAAIIHQYHRREFRGAKENRAFLAKKWPGLDRHIPLRRKNNE